MAGILGARCRESSTGQPCVKDCPILNFAQFETDEEASTNGTGEYYDRKIQDMPLGGKANKREAGERRQERLQRKVDNNDGPEKCGRRPRPYRNP